MACRVTGAEVWATARLAAQMDAALAMMTFALNSTLCRAVRLPDCQTDSVPSGNWQPGATFGELEHSQLATGKWQVAVGR